MRGSHSHECTPPSEDPSCPPSLTSVTPLRSQLLRAVATPCLLQAESRPQQLVTRKAWQGTRRLKNINGNSILDWRMDGGQGWLWFLELMLGEDGEGWKEW